MYNVHNNNENIILGGVVMASEMLELILDAEHKAKKRREECENEAKLHISKAQSDADALIKKAKADAEADAKEKISQAETKAADLIEKKRQEALIECEKMSALLNNKQAECNAVIIKKLIV